MQQEAADVAAHLLFGLAALLFQPDRKSVSWNRERWREYSRLEKEKFSWFFRLQHQNILQMV